MKRIAVLFSLLALVAAGIASAQPGEDKSTQSPDANTTPAASASSDLSAIAWETNLDDPPIGDPNALKGGTLYDVLYSYPLTFRLVGPNSNDSFAGWNRAYTLYFTLVLRHPVTDNYIPCLATHWSVQDDQKTVYFKLDPDAHWSDGHPVTADDYVFCDQMMRSEHIVDPYYNNYFADYFESVEKIDDYTLKIVGTRPSWRPLADYNLWPMPQHAISLGPDWVKEVNNQFQIATGPYVVTEAQPGKRVIFERLKNWWGGDKRYFQGMYNVDRIVLQVITDQDRAFDYFKKGELSMLTIGMARRWATEMDFEAIKKGWVHRKRVFVDFPQGMYGLAMNLTAPIFKNKDFRKAMQYLFNFDVINRELMYNAYYRMVSAFEGTEYANPNLVPYGFDPVKAREHLLKAGFTKRGRDGILVDANGNRAAFTLIYGNKTFEKHLTVVKQIYERAGVKIDLSLLEGAAAFERGLERKYEMTTISRATNLYPSPHQYFHTDFLDNTNNNDIWAFGTPETDELIDIYRFDLDKQKRLDAMHKLDAIVQDEAFYIPFWYAPYIRFVYWDYIRFPEFFLPKRTEQLSDWQVFWIDPARKERLDAAMAKGESLGEDTVVDVDPYSVKAHLEQRAAEPGAGAANPTESE